MLHICNKCTRCLRNNIRDLADLCVRLREAASWGMSDVSRCQHVRGCAEHVCDVTSLGADSWLRFQSCAGKVRAATTAGELHGPIAVASIWAWR